jgi:hypothetical protein
MDDFAASTVDESMGSFLPATRTRDSKVTLALVNRGHNSNLIENATPRKNVRLENAESTKLIRARKDMGKRGTHIDKIKGEVASDVFTLLSDVVASLLNLANKTFEGPNSGRLRMEERGERTRNIRLTAKATHMAVGRTRDIEDRRQTITSTLKLVAIKTARPGLRVHQQLLRRGSTTRLQKKRHRGARKHLFPDLLANLRQQKRRGRNKRDRREANRDGRVALESNFSKSLKTSLTGHTERTATKETRHSSNETLNEARLMDGEPFDHSTRCSSFSTQIAKAQNKSRQ